MKLTLAFDTAMSSTAVGLFGPGVALSQHDLPASGGKPRHAEEVLPLARQLLDEAGVSWGSIQCVAVGIGPGSFTGLRIGISVALGLSKAVKADLVGIPTLTALLEPIAGKAPAAALIDAKRGELFALAGGLATEPILMARGDWSRLPQGAICVGDGAVIEREPLIESGFDVPDPEDSRHLVDPGALARLACDPARTRSAEPIYLRGADAVPTADRILPG